MKELILVVILYIIHIFLCRRLNLWSVKNDKDSGFIEMRPILWFVPIIGFMIIIIIYVMSVLYQKWSITKSYKWFLVGIETPSDFTINPIDSVLQNSESETIARNIMVILSKTGNKFRELSWEEYKRERINEGNFTDREQEYFDKVISYCKSAETAKLFSKAWAK